MNFASLQTGFLEYLSEKLQKSGKEKQAQDVFQNFSTAIITNFSVFKEYLGKVQGTSSGLSSINICDLDKLDFKNGKFVIADEEDDLYTETLNSVLEDENVKKNIDKNQDKDISKTEVMGFLSDVSEEGNISFDNLNEFIDSINKENPVANIDGENTVDNTNETTPVENPDEDAPITIDSLLADKNIASIFALNSDSEELTDEEKETAVSFIKALTGTSETLAENEPQDFEYSADNSDSDIEDGLTQENLKAFIQFFDSDGDGTISEEDSIKARELLSGLSDTEEFSAENIKVFNEFADSVYSQNKDMTPEKFIDFVKGLDGDNSELTVDDFKKLKEYHDLKILPTQRAESPISAEIPENTQLENTEPVQQTDNGVNGTESGETPKTSSGGKGAFSPAIKEKTVSNMSIAELEEELATAKKTQDDAKTKYMQGVESADKELAEKIKNLQTDIDNKQQQLDESAAAVTEQEKTVKDAEAAVKSADDKITDIESQLSNLKAPKESDFPETDEGAAQYSKQKDAYTTKKAELEQKLTDAKEEKSKAEAQLKAEELKLNELNSSKTSFEDELKLLNSKMDEYEAEADKLAVSNPELQSLKEAYDKSKEYVQSVESMLDRRMADRKKKENGDPLPLTYTLDGKEYHCVAIQGIDTDGDGKNDIEFDSYEQFQRYMAQGGVANVGQYGTMQCFNYSQVYGETIMGAADPRFIAALAAETHGQQGDTDTAGKMATQSEYNKRNFAQVKSANRDEEYKVITNELKNGRPCVVSVPYEGGCHYALAIGMSDDGDILIMDSYDCSIKRLGKSNNSDTKREHRNLATGNGVWIYIPGYNFSYSDKRGIDYNYYMQYGQKATLDRILQQRA